LFVEEGDADGARDALEGRRYVRQVSETVAGTHDFLLTPVIHSAHFALLANGLLLDASR
jgi:prephenate dehydrogenase